MESLFYRFFFPLLFQPRVNGATACVEEFPSAATATNPAGADGDDHEVFLDSDNQSEKKPLEAAASASKPTTGTTAVAVAGRQRRSSIPPRPRISLNLWGVLKNCIGKELSRIPLPVSLLSCAYKHGYLRKNQVFLQWHAHLDCVDRDTARR